MTRKTIINSMLFAVLNLLMLQPSQAGVYKWVDESGQVHYGEQPGNSSAQQVQIRKNETTSPRTIKKTDAEDTAQATEEPAKPVEPETPTISKKEKQRLCQQAKSDYAAISSRGRMREINKKGEYIYLTEEQRQQRLATAKKNQREYCH
jgi:hypothetical protein